MIMEKRNKLVINSNKITEEGKAKKWLTFQMLLVITIRSSTKKEKNKRVLGSSVYHHAKSYS